MEGSLGVRRGILRKPDVERLEGRRLLTSMLDVTSNLAHSAENEVRVVDAEYRKVLGRAPTPAEVSAVAGELKAGLTDEQLVADLAGSAEDFARAGSSDAPWVASAYEAILGRPASASEVQAGLAALAAGSNRTAVAGGLATSTEHDIDLIVGDYQSVLGRAPSASELDSWVGSLRAGTTDETALAEFVASPEAYADQNGFDFDWAYAAYEDILGRTPDGLGLVDSLLALEGGPVKVLQDLDGLIASLVQTEENTLVSDATANETGTPTLEAPTLDGDLDLVRNDLADDAIYTPHTIQFISDELQEYKDVNSDGLPATAAILNRGNVLSESKTILQLESDHLQIVQVLQAADQTTTTIPLPPATHGSYNEDQHFYELRGATVALGMSNDESYGLP